MEVNEMVNGDDEDARQLGALSEALKISTGGKLTVVTSDDAFPPTLAKWIEPIDLSIGENVRLLRRSVRCVAHLASLNEEMTDALEIAAGEAANNCIVHAVGAKGQVFWNDKGDMQIRVWDNGPGIPYNCLPQAVLEHGYSTAGTLGQGFKIILESVQNCWIKTAKSGTILVLQQTQTE